MKLNGNQKSKILQNIKLHDVQTTLYKMIYRQLYIYVKMRKWTDMNKIKQ